MLNSNQTCPETFLVIMCGAYKDTCYAVKAVLQSMMNTCQLHFLYYTRALKTWRMSQENSDKA